MTPRTLLTALAAAAGALLALASNARAGSYAYATDYSHAVTVVDLATNEVRGLIEIGQYLPRGIALDRRGRRAFVANECGIDDCESYTVPSSVSVIDTTSLSIVATVPVTGRPDYIAANRAGTRLYVSNFYANIAVIDIAGASVIDNLPILAGPLALSRNDARLYVGGGNLRVVDLATNAVREEPRFRHVDALALGRSGKRIFVASCGRPCSEEASGPMSVDVMDAETLEVLATIPIADDFVPGGLTVDRSGRHLYLSGFGQNSGRSMVWAIDTKRAAVTAAIPVQNWAMDLALHPHERRLYVTAFFQGDTMTVIDTRTNTVIDEPGLIFSFRLAIGRAPAPAAATGR